MKLADVLDNTNIFIRGLHVSCSCILSRKLVSLMPRRHICDVIQGILCSEPELDGP